MPPPLTERDTVIRADREWQHAAEAYKRLKNDAEAATARLDEAKASLVDLSSHTSEKGAGVCVSRFWKAGAVDYKKVPALTGIDLDQYRGPSREEVRVSVAR